MDDILKGKVLDSGLEGNVRANSVLDKNDQRPWSVAHNGHKFAAVLPEEVKNVEKWHRPSSRGYIPEAVN
jgi:hypothetical protein